MLSLEIKPSERFGERIYGLAARTRRQWNEKLGLLADLLYDKVIENLSGKVLQTKTQQLRGSITKEVSTSGYDFIAFVGPEPATPKAYALEFGGKSSYLIPVGPKGVLANRETDFFSKHDVIHPPSLEYRYLRSARDDVALIAPKELLIDFLGF